MKQQSYVAGNNRITCWLQKDKPAAPQKAENGHAQKDNNHYRTLKKTRKFVVDGREVTTTQKKIVTGQEDAKKTAFAHQNR